MALMRIGDLARLSGVSVRMLRHYDRIGVLVPTHVDAASGRRRYSTAQLDELNRLLAWRALGFGLREARELVDSAADVRRMRAALEERRSAVEASVRRQRFQLDRIEARLRVIDGEDETADGIVVKEVPAQHMAGLHSWDGRTEALFERVIERMSAVRADRSVPVARYLPDSERVRCDAGYVLDDPRVPGLEVIHLPAADVATTLHTGAMAGIGAAYRRVTEWAATRGHPLDDAHWRILFLETDRDDQSDWIVEVQLELG